MAQRQATSWLHEPGVTLRDGQPYSSRDQGSTAGGGDDGGGASQQVGAGIAGPGVAGHAQIRVEDDDRDLEHTPKGTDPDGYPDC